MPNKIPAEISILQHVSCITTKYGKKKRVSSYKLNVCFNGLRPMNGNCKYHEFYDPIYHENILKNWKQQTQSEFNTIKTNKKWFKKS